MGCGQCMARRRDLLNAEQELLAILVHNHHRRTTFCTHRLLSCPRRLSIIYQYANPDLNGFKRRFAVSLSAGYAATQQPKDRKLMKAPASPPGPSLHIASSLIHEGRGKVLGSAPYSLASMMTVTGDDAFTGATFFSSNGTNIMVASPEPARH